MRNRIVLLRLTFRRSPLLFLIPIGLVYLIIPFCVLASMRETGPEEGLRTFIYAIQFFLPAGALQWAMAYLQVWIDSDGQEAMRACRGGRTSRVPDLLTLLLCFLIMLLPGMLYSVSFFGFQWNEYLRAAVETVFSVCVLYVLSVLLNSVTMGGMAVMLYLLFCAFFSEDPAVGQWSLLQAEPLRDVQALLRGYGGLGCASAVLFAFGAFLERRSGCRNG